MSENTLNSALRRLGYGGDEMKSHGFRAIASTLLNESGLWHPDASSAHSRTRTATRFELPIIAKRIGQSGCG